MALTSRRNCLCSEPRALSWLIDSTQPLSNRGEPRLLRAESCHSPGSEGSKHKTAQKAKYIIRTKTSWLDTARVQAEDGVLTTAEQVSASQPLGQTWSCQHFSRKRHLKEYSCRAKPLIKVLFLRVIRRPQPQHRPRPKPRTAAQVFFVITLIIPSLLNFK